MALPNKIKLAKADGTPIVGEIVSLNREMASTAIDQAWKADMVNSEPDSHWEWRALVSKCQNKPRFTSVAVIAENSVHAAMILRTDLLSLVDKSPIVTIERIASAPRNRVSLFHSNRYLSGAGEGLLSYAIANSYEFGFDGRIQIDPIANVDFYTQYGFKPSAIGKNGEQWYELPGVAAVEFLTKRGVFRYE